MNNTDSILETIKARLGIDASYDPFDKDLITLINMAFGTLFQLGVGASLFEISGSDETWEDLRSFLGLEAWNGRLNIGTLATYISLKVRMLFDTPISSVVGDALSKQISESEWRICFGEE